MPKTVDDAVVDARAILQDERTPYRYPLADIVRYFNESFAEMRRIRPDIFVGRYLTELPTFTTSDLDMYYPISDMYFSASVDYIVYRIGVRDDQSINENRAEAFYKMFLQSLRVA